MSVGISARFVFKIIPAIDIGDHVPIFQNKTVYIFQLKCYNMIDYEIICINRREKIILYKKIQK